MRSQKEIQEHYNFLKNQYEELKGRNDLYEDFKRVREKMREIAWVLNINDCD